MAAALDAIDDTISADSGSIRLSIDSIWVDIDIDIDTAASGLRRSWPSMARNICRVRSARSV